MHGVRGGLLPVEAAAAVGDGKEGCCEGVVVADAAGVAAVAAAAAPVTVAVVHCCSFSIDHP